MTIAIVAAQGHDNAGRRKASARASAKARLGHDKAHEFALQRPQRRRCLLPSPPIESSRRGHQHNRGKAAENFQAGPRAIVPRNSLKRLYDAIENGIADVSDPMLKERVTELKSIRDQARAAEGSLKPSPARPAGACGPSSGGYRRDHLRALAERVEVDTKEVRIMGSKSVLLRTLVAASSAKTADFGVPSFVPKWRARRDSNS